MAGHRYAIAPVPKASFAQRLREARRLAQNYEPNWTDIPYRAISIFPTLVLARARVTPNQVTVLWTVTGLLAVFALASADGKIRLAGAVALQLSYVLDLVDGELARMNDRSTNRGCFLDLVGHGLVKTALFLPTGYGLFVGTQKSIYLILAFCACVSISGIHGLKFYVTYVSGQHSALAAKDRPRRKRNAVKWILIVTNILFESPGLYGMILLGVVFNGLHWVVLFYGLVGPPHLLCRVVKYCYGWTTSERNPDNLSLFR